MINNLNNIDDNIVTLIAGKLNNCTQTYYWRVNFDFNIGDYAIVENMNDYDLVKIVGTVITTEKYIKHISNSVITKKVVKILKRNEVRGD